jgi:hypothetical protein
MALMEAGSGNPATSGFPSPCLRGGQQGVEFRELLCGLSPPVSEGGVAGPHIYFLSRDAPYGRWLPSKGWPYRIPLPVVGGSSLVVPSERDQKCLT